MHNLLYNALELLPCFVSPLVAVVIFYDGLTMIDMIGANHKNTVHGECVFFFSNLKTNNSMEGPLVEG